MESRKRAFADEEAVVNSKKRVLSDTNGSPRANGISVEAEDPKDQGALEQFRKEAIFRRMKHYSREYARSQAHVAELEKRKITCEAGVAAISACWTQLVEAIRLLVRPEELPQVDVKTTELFDLTIPLAGDTTPGLLTTLKGNMGATQQLIAKFFELGSSRVAMAPREETYMKCQRAQTENAGLRSQLNILRIRVDELQAQREELKASLAEAETRADRSESNAVLKMKSQVPLEKKPPEAEETIELKQEEPPSPVNVPLIMNGLSAQETNDWQDIAKLREQKIKDLEGEYAILRDQLNIATVNFNSLTKEVITDSPHYKILVDHASFLEHAVKEEKEKVAFLLAELKELRNGRKEFEESVTIAAGQANQELKTLLSKRDSENARLREQREQQTIEMSERKFKDPSKMIAPGEYMKLAESRSERIHVLQSELRRVKAQLAANAGNEDLMLFFFRDQMDDMTYIDDLKRRLNTAEERVSALEQSISALPGDGTANIIAADSSTRQQIADLKKQLGKYESIYGKTSTSPVDIQKLSEHLHQKEDEIQRLRMKETQRNQAETSLYAELDKLSAAWEVLDRGLQSKVFDLSALEERLAKSGLDKAKSDNKYFAAMRDKDALETERKACMRNIEKQTKLCERLVESERNLQAQLIDLEGERTEWKVTPKVTEDRLVTAEKDVAALKLRIDAEQKKATEAQLHLQAKEKAIDKTRAELRTLEEEMLRSKKDLERQKVKTTLLHPTALGKEGGDETYDKAMRIMKCSACMLNMRDSIISKCSHTFCKQCMDTRISTRQRKCPACNLPFSQSDVMPFYLQ